MKKCHLRFLDLDREEEWINRYIRQGWRLKNIRGFRYEFIPKETGTAPRKGEVPPDESAFLVRCDLRSFKMYSEYQNYVMMLEDAGWRHIIGNMNGYAQYFERIRPDADEEIFSDHASKAAGYLRLLKRYLFSLITYVFTILLFFITNPFSLGENTVIRIFLCLLLVLELYAAGKIYWLYRRR